ncbi:hypothetical protein BJF78_22620 [Pseudonocardia sp. CNS-139]|nr:hypothetical protein BJF78_22620 [Pseudonocardia sp. CNS-139]
MTWTAFLTGVRAGEFDTGLAWRTSTWSGDGESCVEVAPTADGVLVRNSRRRDGGTIAFGAAEWSAFLAGVRGGEFTSHA